MKLTETLSGAELDLWVARAEGVDAVIGYYGGVVTYWGEDERYDPPRIDGRSYRPTEHWSDGGPILDKMRLSMIPITMGRYVVWGDGIPRHYGATLLIAAMRARVFMAFGEEVDDGLCDVQ